MSPTSALRRLTALWRRIPFGVWILFAALLGGVIGLGTFTFVYAEGYSYMVDDPSACANCHIMRDVYDGWNRGSHKAVATCNDCHTPHSTIPKYAIKGLNGLRHSTAFTTGDFPEPIHITPFDRRIAEENCLRCHGDLVSQIAHLDASQPADCLACHRSPGH